MYSAQEEQRLEAVAAAQPHATEVKFTAVSAHVVVQSVKFPQFRTEENLTLLQIQNATTRRDVEDMIKSNNDLISDRVKLHTKQLKEAADAKARVLRGRKR